MPDHLHLELQLDNDGTAELFARVEANGFCGRGSAWIHPQDLADLGSKLSKAFPLQETLEIRGGNWSSSRPLFLEQEHLGLSFYPVEGRGVVGCQVRLATQKHSEDRPGKQHVVRAELLSSYEELLHFSAALTMLASGGTHEAVLHAVAV